MEVPLAILNAETINPIHPAIRRLSVKLPVPAVIKEKRAMDRPVKTADNMRKTPFDCRNENDAIVIAPNTPPAPITVVRRPTTAGPPSKYSTVKAGSRIANDNPRKPTPSDRASK